MQKRGCYSDLSRLDSFEYNPLPKSGAQQPDDNPKDGEATHFKLTWSLGSGEAKLDQEERPKE